MVKVRSEGGAAERGSTVLYSEGDWRRVQNCTDQWRATQPARERRQTSNYSNQNLICFEPTQQSNVSRQARLLHVKN